jgi:menaquinone-dependent protoporphyrinogen IX oxidase
VRSIDEITNFERYDAVVFGSGVYDGSWTAEAIEVVRHHAAVLARKPPGCSALDRSAIDIRLSAN